MKKHMFYLGKLVFIGTALALAGCATMSIPPKYEPTNFTLIHEINKVEVSMDPFSDQEKIKKYFGTDLISLGIFPVYIRIVNGSTSSSYLFDEKTLTLKIRTEAFINHHPKNIAETDSGEGTAVAAVFISPLFLPLALLGGKMLSDASVINFTFNRNKLHPTTISPGKDISGFVYFSLPDKGTIPNNWKLVTSLKNVTGGENIEFTM